MLVLSRHKDESIVINNDTEVMVVDIRGDKVRLGVAAPKSVPVHRKEVQEAILKEGGAARLGSTSSVSNDEARIADLEYCLNAVLEWDGGRNRLPADLLNDLRFAFAGQNGKASAKAKGGSLATFIKG